MRGTALSDGETDTYLNFDFTDFFAAKNYLETYRSFEMTIDEIIDSSLEFKGIREENTSIIFYYEPNKNWNNNVKVKVYVTWQEIEYSVHATFNGIRMYARFAERRDKACEPTSEQEDIDRYMNDCWDPLISQVRRVSEDRMKSVSETYMRDDEKKRELGALERFYEDFDSEVEARKMVTCLRTLVSGSKKRASKMGLDFNIDIKYIMALYEGKCEISGIPLELMTNKKYSKQPFKPSLDRINNNKGYVKGNIRIVCTMVNFAKNVWSDEDLKWMLDGYRFKGLSNQLDTYVF